MDINKKLVEEFKIRKDQVENTIKLLDEGNTVPFIARYRKEVTGGLEDIVIRDLAARLEYLRNLEDRKEEVLRLIDEQEKLSPELKADILKAESLQRVDDLYRPYRPKRRTRGMIAREKGLEAFSDFLLGNKFDAQALKEEVEKYLDPEKELATEKDVIESAQDIIAEDISDRANYRELIREIVEKEGLLTTELIKDAEDKKNTYEMYYDYSEQLSKVANHRVLAINRAEKEKVVRVKLEVDEEKALYRIRQELLREYGHVNQFLEEALVDSYNRLIFPSIEREIRNKLTEVAEEDAIKVFALNLEPLLLQPPIKGKNVLALDPGFRTGCKLAVVDETGRLLDYTTIFPTEPRKDIAGSKKTIKDMVAKYNVDIISIGNGTASRETELVVAETLAEIGDRKLAYIIVSEAGASIYSASDLAREEFPDLDVSIRGAVSIARRLQDPLAELVKIDPKHIGVGQYQHDLNQKKLDQALAAVVEDSVNSVGVDLNTASPALLSYVSGVSKRVAKNILDYRNEEGSFSSRKELLKVKGLGPKTFVQCAGFLRIPTAENTLDNTGVHPESYKVAEKLLEMDYRTRDLEDLAEELEVGSPTLRDIIAELEKPGRDPRDEMPKPILRQDVLKIEDLKEDMVVKGTVRNVVDFGAFVDIGVTEDGLVHISKLANRYVKHPKEVVEVGDIIDVRIISIDREKGRISLSMKDL